MSWNYAPDRYNELFSISFKVKDMQRKRLSIGYDWRRSQNRTQILSEFLVCLIFAYEKNLAGLMEELTEFPEFN